MQLQDLSWLPEPPEDFKNQLKEMMDSSKLDGQNLKQMASYRLSDRELNRLAKTLQKLIEKKADLSPLTPLKVGVIGNFTTSLFINALKASGLRHGILLDIYEADYDQMPQETLDPDSGLNLASCEVVFFALDCRNMPMNAALGDGKDAEAAVESAFNTIMQYRESLMANAKSTPPLCLFQTLVAPVGNNFGSLEGQIEGTDLDLVHRFNQKLLEHVSSSADQVFDAGRLATVVGLQTWSDPVSWYMGKFNFSHSMTAFYGDALARVLAAIKGKTKKVLVLDLDNTLWGGVIGDDGLNGIKIGQGSAIGEAFLNIQKTVLKLRERGIVLAVCSKNNDDIARSAFREHPEMALKENHISVFQANWDDKATNIKAIADHLSLGLDSVVFLDDNPAERQRVRQMLPDVSVPELPDDPALYPSVLLGAGYFESVAFSGDDKKRADYYHGNAERLKLQKNLGNYDDYLASLDMKIIFQPFNDIGRERITQLINKTNQFNLTTRRYTEADVEAFQNDADGFAMQVRLEDKFGDNGMISVIICRREDVDTWNIDTWLMSCRVLKRKVEEASLLELVSHAKKKGIKTLKGCYTPTAKNDMVKSHYEKMGFVHDGKDGDSDVWRLEINGYQETTLPMIIENADFQHSDIKMAVG